MFENEKVFPQRLKALRLEKGLTGPELGEKIGYTKQAINNWEAGRTEPNIATLCRLADALEVDLNFLVGRSDSHGSALV